MRVLCCLLILLFALPVFGQITKIDRLYATPSEESQVVLAFPSFLRVYALEVRETDKGIWICLKIELDWPVSNKWEGWLYVHRISYTQDK